MVSTQHLFSGWGKIVAKELRKYEDVMAGKEQIEIVGWVDERRWMAGWYGNLHEQANEILGWFKASQTLSIGMMYSPKVLFSLVIS